MAQFQGQATKRGRWAGGRPLSGIRGFRSPSPKHCPRLGLRLFGRVRGGATALFALFASLVALLDLLLIVVPGCSLGEADRSGGA